MKKKKTRTNLDSLVYRPGRQNVYSSRLFTRRRLAIHPSFISFSPTTRTRTRTRTSNDGPPPGHARDKMTVRFYRFRASAVCKVPYLDGLVVRGGEEVFARRVEDERADPVIVADLRCELLG